MKIKKVLISALIFSCFTYKLFAQISYEFSYQFSPYAHAGSNDSIPSLRVSDLIIHNLDVIYVGKYVNNYSRIDQIINTDKLKSANINVTVNEQQAMYIDYDRKLIYLSNADSFQAFHLNFPRLRKTSIIQDIAGYRCTKYEFEEENLKKYEIWASDSVPWFINPGYFDEKLKSGIVRIVNRDQGEITLKSFKEIPKLALEIPVAREISKTPIMSPLISQ